MVRRRALVERSPSQFWPVGSPRVLAGLGDIRSKQSSAQTVKDHAEEPWLAWCEQGKREPSGPSEKLCLLLGCHLLSHSHWAVTQQRSAAVSDAVQKSRPHLR